ncbi:MAG: pyrroline-5-carboxylate reductase [Proteobacteria bacterium]|nr:pyrroline-5-carboxylate reductase [Pseudomonadota bacterium]
MDTKLTIIGCGNMGSAIAEAILQRNIFVSSAIRIIEKVDNDYIRKLKSEGAEHFAAIEDIGNEVGLVILAVKPQNAKDVLNSLSNCLTQNALILSIMAGISIQTIENQLGDVQVVRTMPNTPCIVQKGMSVYCGNSRVDSESYQLVDRILDAMGKAIQVDDEKMIDAATAISGSGPAYIFYLAESLQVGAEKLGFSPEQSKILASQTLLGASTLLDISPDSASILKQKVTSPGGTTEAALRSFDDDGLKEKLVKGFIAAFDRSIELGKS